MNESVTEVFVEQPRATPGLLNTTEGGRGITVVSGRIWTNLVQN